jgi:arylformamidase
MKLYDITRPVTARTPVWPGDTSYSAESVLRLEDGSSVNLTTLHTTPHVGTHADAWFHYEANGAHPVGMPLDAYVGPARVLSVAKRDGPLTPDDFPPGSLIGVERLLIHSYVSELPDDVWPDPFPYLSVELLDVLARQGARLVGLDSPSVDELTSKELPCHHALYAHHMVNLESVLLKDVPDGNYELVALPLKLDDACASPVRAILRG